MPPVVANVKPKDVRNLGLEIDLNPLWSSVSPSTNVEARSSASLQSGADPDDSCASVRDIVSGAA